MGKNPSYGFPADYELRINTFLSEECSMEEHITINRSNYKTTDGQKVQVYGIIVDRSRSRVITAAIRKPKHINGLYVKLKADKIHSKSYDKALLNIRDTMHEYFSQ
jgi:hypothetical protein